MAAYLDALCEAMSLVAAKTDAIFVGQAVSYPGTAMYTTLDHLPVHQRLELPVMEESQLGMSIGLALAGYLPVCVYPRMNFLLLAVNQLVNHLDALPLFGAGYNPKVIIRTAVPTSVPLDPGPQHLGDFTYAMKEMLRTIEVFKVRSAENVLLAYRAALARPGSSLIVEYSELYD